ncbi:amidohydrolase family protein [Clostridium sp.]|uniref:amidohydrolase family protein n=1 Tax=Clostridium sp. TaxID=1506 RepID=UPI003D6D85E2
MKTIKTLIKNVKILTVDTEMSVIENGFIGIDGSDIVFIEREENITVDKFDADKVINAMGKMAIPGFVNTHVHSPMTILRCYGDDLPLNKWLFEKMIPAEEKFSHEDIYWGGMLGVLEQIKSGVTCFAEMYEPSNVMMDVVVENNIRANVAGPHILITPEKEYQEYVSHIKKWNNSHDGLIKEYAIIHAIYTYSEEKIKARVAAAKEAKTGIQIHISEAPYEQEQIFEKYGTTPMAKLQEWGVFDVPTIAAHCVHLTDGDFEILKNRNVSVAHCPSSNLKLASGIADVPRMIKKGINVTLGTDGASSNSNLNFVEEMHLASLIHKGNSMDPLAVNAKEVIRMATVNGAKATGFGDVTGCLEVGKKADINLIDMDKAHLTPLNNPMSAMVYSMQGSDVDTVIVNGKILMENKDLKFVDEEKIKYQVRLIAKKLSLNIK